MLQYVLVVILITLLCVAVYYELNDYKEVMMKKAKTEQDKTKFYACFNFRDYVAWRLNFIFSSVAIVFIYCYFNFVSTKSLQTSDYFMLFFIIFFAHYMLASFRNFHIYRPLCNSCK